MWHKIGMAHQKLLKTGDSQHELAPHDDAKPGCKLTFRFNLRQLRTLHPANMITVQKYGARLLTQAALLGNSGLLCQVTLECWHRFSLPSSHINAVPAP